MGDAFSHEGLHEGFSTAANQVFDFIEQEIRSLYGLEVDKTTFVICGHSRGAAVGNLLGKRLVDDAANTSRFYCYSFSCPDTAHRANYDWRLRGLLDSMFNISDASDPVSWLPGNLGSVLGGSAALSLYPLNGCDLADMSADWGKFGLSRWFRNDQPNSGNALNPFAGHDPKYCLSCLATLPKFDDFMLFSDAQSFERSFWDVTTTMG